MAGRPKGTTESKQMSLMAGLRKPVEFQNEDFVFTMAHHVGGKKLLIKDCDSDIEILVPSEYLYFLKQVIDAEMKAIQQIAPPKDKEEETKAEAHPPHGDETDDQTADEVLASLGKGKATAKDVADKK